MNFRIFAAAGMALALSAPALAEDEPGTTDNAEAVVEEIVADAEADESGTMQPSTGGAEPTENWFGCKPDSGEQQDSCEEG